MEVRKVMCNYACGCQDIPMMSPLARKYMKIFMNKYESAALYNIEDIGNEYLITILLPGRSKEDVQLSLVNHSLNIKASKPKRDDAEYQKDIKSDNKPRMFRIKNFVFIDVDMDIELPENADLNTIESKMSMGILEIKIGKNPVKPLNIHDEDIE